MAGMPLRHGTHVVLEEAADALLRESMRGISHSQHDILTRWKYADRRRHELFVDSGVPDSSVRRGCFWRSYNAGRPELNSREGAAPVRRSVRFGATTEHDEHPERWE